MKKKIVFVTGTRADYGKIKSILKLCIKKFNVKIYTTGMHLLPKFGNTYKEIEKSFSNKILIKRNNQIKNSSLDLILAKTIFQFSQFIKKFKPNLILVHGDRAEAFAAAIVSSLNNILLAHIEGGERSGNIDEHIRHSISKLSHIHFVSNNSAKKRLIKLGEIKNKIFITGNPDIDILRKKNLPSLNQVKKRYEIKFNKYIILLFHPDAISKKKVKDNFNTIVNSLVTSKKKTIVIFPNNDYGSEVIINTIENKLNQQEQFKIIKSMRFEYYLTLLKNSQMIVGNSSSGVHEAPFYGVPTLNIGHRQKNRAKLTSIINLDYNKKNIIKKIYKYYGYKFKKDMTFGTGNSASKIYLKLISKNIWNTKTQKYISY